MKDSLKEITEALNRQTNTQKAHALARFFKTGKGEYGEGDLFIGIPIPQVRDIVKIYQHTPLPVVHELLLSPIHEYRMTAVLLLVHRFEKEKDQQKRKEYVDFYIQHVDHLNNWDLVDLSCYKLLGRWLEDKEKTLLYEWARTGHLWKQRIAIVSCMYFVKRGKFEECLEIADILQFHSHDLIHKAVGWLLREVGKKNRQILTDYLTPRYRQMPRTMLRYAIEHYPEESRKAFLKRGN